MFKGNRTRSDAVPMFPTDDHLGPRPDPLGDAHANLDHAYGRIQDLTEQNQGLAIEIRQLVEDLALVAREYDHLDGQALPHLDTPTWPQAAPVRAVICDELAADTDGFEPCWHDEPDAGSRYWAVESVERLPSRQAVSP